MRSAVRSLRLIKVVHTIVWAFFAMCVFAIPVFAATGRTRTAAVFIAIVFVEVLILMMNGGHCPLTAIAARHTEDRHDNFDIYLPEWVARYNKTIFSVLYVIGILVTVVRSSG